jgi:UDP-glucose-4-epimerase GalE
MGYLGTTSRIIEMPKVVMVTGGAGYIGSHVCKMLAERGSIPVCFDSLEKGHEWAVKWGPLVHGDIGDVARLDETFIKYRPWAVIHLAGYIEVGESVLQPERYLRNNTTKTQKLIEASIRHGVQAFVFSSTCAVYGTPQTEFLSETHPIGPLNPYADSKVRVEAALVEAAKQGKLRSVALRYFNAAGADEGGEIGEAHSPETHLIPLAIDAAIGLRGPLLLHGTDFDTIDGSCVRDFVHVADLSHAHISALDWISSLDRPGHFEAFNLGSGHGFSVLETLKRIEFVLGNAVPFIVGSRRPGDSSRLVGNIDKAREILRWQPVRDLHSQISDALRWRRTMPR